MKESRPLAHASATFSGESRYSREMVADFVCVLMAWAAAYLLRLGIERIYVVTLVPEVLFIIVCAAATVFFLQLRGQYRNYRTRFHRADAKRIVLIALGVGFGFSAIARFLDIEIISRAAILIAPPMAAFFMINWRLAIDHLGPMTSERLEHPPKSSSMRRAIIIVNLDEFDLTPLRALLDDPEVDFDLIVYGLRKSQANIFDMNDNSATQRTGKIIFRDIENIYLDIRTIPDAVIALPEEKIATWQADSRYIPLSGHRFVSIESLVRRARDPV